MDSRRLPGALVAITLLLQPPPGDAVIAADELTPAETEHSLERAHELLAAGEAADAAREFKALASGPLPHGPAVEGRVRALIRQDLWGEALAEARRFHADHSEDPLVASALAEALLRAGLPEDCRRIVEPLAGATEPPARALMTLARLEVARGDTAEARRLLARASQLAPEDRDVAFHAAEVAASGADAIRGLERYFELSDGDDPDRIQAARETVELLRQLGDRRTWVPLNQPEQLELPLRRLIDATGRPLGFIVRARVGSSPKAKPIRLLLDTGAGGLHVVERIARKRDVELLGESTLFGGGGEQRHSAQRGIFPQLELGELTFTDALVTTAPDDLDPQGRFHGVLGISVFDGYRVTLDLKKQRLRLERVAVDDTGIPYWMFNGQMLVRVSTTAGPSGLFLFDTGAVSTLVSQRFVETVPTASLGPPASVQAYGGRDAGARVARGLRLTFAGETSRSREFNARDLTLRSRLGGIEVSGFLGLDFFGSSTVLIDTRSRRLTLDLSGQGTTKRTKIGDSSSGVSRNSSKRRSSRPPGGIGK